MVNPPLKLAYNPALDGLRGVAIVLVMLSHAHVPMFEGAFFGVDLFFVLSGYLITSLLLIEARQTGGIDVWRFWRRRLFRLMPALLLFLGVYCLVAPLLWPNAGDWYSDALVSALYLADYGIAFFDQPSSLLHMWSLSVEEHFYLVWPLLVVVLARRVPRGHWWRCVLALLVVAWVWRLYWVAQGQLFYEIFFRFDTRATGLLAGSLLAALVIEQPAWFRHVKGRLNQGLWLVLLVPLLMSLKWDDMAVMTWGMTVVELATMVLLLAVMPRQGLVFEMLNQPALIKLGQLSYGIYLWHYPVFRALRAHMDWPAVLLLGGLLSAGIAALSYHTIERWALRRRDGGAPAAERPLAHRSAHP